MNAESINTLVWLCLASLLLINTLVTFLVVVHKQRMGLYKSLLVVGIWILPLLGAIIALINLSGKQPLNPTNTAYDSKIPGDV